MRVIWLDINSSYSHSSLAIPSLDAQLDSSVRNSADWKIISGTVSANPAEVLSNIYRERPDILLSTVWLFNYNYIISLLKNITILLPNTRVILGGPEYLGDNRSFLEQNKYVEAVVRGDGEAIYSELINRLIFKRPIHDLNGICTILKDRYVDNGHATVESLSTLNIPENSCYFQYTKPFVQIETSRGCFNSCKFCVSGIKESVSYIDYNTFRKRLENLRERGIRNVRILDRTFNANPNHSSQLLAIMKSFSGEMTFHVEIHPGFLSKSVREILKTIPVGLIHAEVGIQSLNHDVIKLSGRKGSPEKTLEGLKFLRALNNIEIHADLIIGLPGYTRENLLSDYKQLVSIGVDEIQVELLKILPGTEFRNNHHKYGLKYSTFPPYEVLETDVMTYDDTISSMILSKMSDLWYNKPEWKAIITLLIITQERFLEDFLEYLSTKEIQSINSEKCGLMLYIFCKNHYQLFLVEVSNAWIQNGFSLNKEPGKIANRWDRKFKGVLSPFVEPDFELYTYYYIDCNECTYWYSYKKDTKSLYNYISLSKKSNTITERKTFQ